VISVIVAGASVYGLFWRIDLDLYDASLPTRAAPADVVIVAIDDASIAQIGRWPWRRAVHAALLDQLRALSARAVAFDILMTEPDPTSAANDAALATAMSQGPPTILPLLVRFPRGKGPIAEELPIPVLARAAAAIGHVNVEVDPDGMVRSVFLHEGLGKPNRSYLATALLETARGGASTTQLCEATHPDLAHAAAGAWVRDCQILIPYIGPPGHFAQVSYVDVLSGAVGASAVRGKLVLVGATAEGVADAWSTPRSGEAQAMPGVEVMANVLQAQRSGTLIRKVPLPESILLSLLPIYVLALGLRRLTPRWSMVFGATIWLATLGASIAALHLLYWWWPPTTALFALLMMYPLWSWRRLVATQSFLDEELARLAGEQRRWAGPVPQSVTPVRDLDSVDRRIELLRGATRSLRDARRQLGDTISGLPDATMVADTAGNILLANPAAAKLFGASDFIALEGTAVDTHLHQRTSNEALRFITLAAAAPCTVELMLGEPVRHYLLRAAPFLDSDQRNVGTIIALTDITDLHKAQRERDDIIRFLSHDMKSPASSLLGLAQLQRDPQRALPPAELSHRLDVLAQRTLTLLDGFVALARAESVDPSAFEEFDIRDSVQDAYDEVWAAASAREISISYQPQPELVLLNGDRQLLARAIVNLLGNSIKFSTGRSNIKLQCEPGEQAVTIRVADEGPGIKPEEQAHLFQRFSRRVPRGASDPGGAGLGLAFVRVVAEKHGGRVWVESNGTRGATFCLSIPATAVDGSQA
jgi:PAS domain S-box-containing protein